MEIEIEAKRIAAVVTVAALMAAPALAQAAPRSASTQDQLQQESTHRSARHHSAYRYEHRPAYRHVYYPPEISDQEDGIIADSSGANPLALRPIHGHTTADRMVDCENMVGVARGSVFADPEARTREQSCSSSH